jgi:ATP-binding cassette subfamily G (WHITE) protein 2 (SNQ2)
MTDALVTTLGLKHTLKTKVGNEYVHGISGGERKRVSLAEMVGFLLGASACKVCDRC